MRRSLIGLLLGLLLVVPAPAFWQSRDSNYNTKIAAGSAYVGPGDVLAGAWGYWGLRCYSTASTGNIADFTDGATGNTTGTRLQCSAGGVISAVVSGSACTFVTGNACSSLATTCAISCKIEELYNQSGGGGPNFTQSTTADRFVYTANCVNTSVPCMSNATAFGGPLGATGVTLAQPFSAFMSAENTGGSGVSATAGGNSGAWRTGFRVGSGCDAYAGSEQTQACTQSVWHTTQIAFNGASSAWSVDGTELGTVSLGTGAMSSSGMNLGDDYNGNPNEGNLFEVFIYASAVSSANRGLLNTNQCKYLGLC